LLLYLSPLLTNGSCILGFQEQLPSSRARHDGVCGWSPKIRAGEAAGKVAEIAHQVHGAIGFTHEHSLHRLTRRLWSWRDEFGTESHWSRELGREVMSAGADALWPTMSLP
jgi:alkylation response protein AidB-like acyl-CoA dehydrogenase